jgi:DNA-binding beta-propeller fold protein YncE
MLFRKAKSAGVLIAVAALVLSVASLAHAEPLGAVTRLALTAEGDVLVSDYRNQRVLVLDGNDLEQVKDVIAIAGRPLGLAWNGDRLYVGNDTTGNIEVYRKDQQGKWKAQGRLTSLLYTIEAPGILLAPIGIALDRFAGLVLVSDLGDPSGFFSPRVPASVKIFDYDGDYLDTISGSAQTGFQFSRPQGLAVDDEGNIYLADSFLGQVLVFDGNSLTGQTVLGSKGTGPGQLLHPLDVEIDPVTLDVLITSRMTERVVVFPGGAAP